MPAPRFTYKCDHCELVHRSDLREDGEPCSACGGKGTIRRAVMTAGQLRATLAYVPAETEIRFRTEGPVAGSLLMQEIQPSGKGTICFRVEGE